MALSTENLKWAYDLCRRNRIKKTRPLESVLKFLAQRKMPISWHDLSEAKSIQEVCDETTVFRIIGKLQKAGILRQVGLLSRRSYYVLSSPGTHCDYLICRNCGDIKALPGSCPIHHLENQIQKDLGFKTLFHELEIYGICLSCAPSSIQQRSGAGENSSVKLTSTSQTQAQPAQQ